MAKLADELDEILFTAAVLNNDDYVLRYILHFANYIINLYVCMYVCMYVLCSTYVRFPSKLSTEHTMNLADNKVIIKIKINL